MAEIQADAQPLTPVQQEALASLQSILLHLMCADDGPKNDGYAMNSLCNVVRLASHNLPSAIISFCGHFGSGKTRLVASLQRKEDFAAGRRPIIHPPGSDHAETSDISIFPTHNFGVSQFESSYLLDCEGSDATGAGRMWAAIGTALAGLPGVDRLFGVVEESRRKAIVDHVLPSLVYSFTDILVYVSSVPLSDTGAAEEILTFANNAKQTKNTPWKPVLVVVSNRASRAPDDSLPAVSHTTETFRTSVQSAQTRHPDLLPMDELFEAYFATQVPLWEDDIDNSGQLPEAATRRLTECIQTGLNRVRTDEHRMCINAALMFDYVRVAASRVRVGTVTRAQLGDAVRDAVAENASESVAAAIRLFQVAWTSVERTQENFSNIQILCLRYLLALLMKLYRARDVDEIIAQVRSAVVEFFSATNGAIPCSAMSGSVSCTQEKGGHGHKHYNPAARKAWSGAFQASQIHRDRLIAQLNDLLPFPPPLSPELLSRVDPSFVVTDGPTRVHPLHMLTLLQGPVPVGSPTLEMPRQFNVGMGTESTTHLYSYKGTTDAFADVENLPGVLDFLVERIQFSLLVLFKMQGLLHSHRARQAVAFVYGLGQVRATFTDLSRILRDGAAEALEQIPQTLNDRLRLALGFRDTPAQQQLAIDSAVVATYICLVCGRPPSVTLNCMHAVCEECAISLHQLGQGCPMCSQPVHDVGVRVTPVPPHCGARLLTIDGGGVRGAASAIVLSACVDRLRSFLAVNSVVDVRDFFDLLGGTSAGGILSIAIAIGVSPTNAISLSQSVGRRVFVEWNAQDRAARLSQLLADALQDPIAHDGLPGWLAVNGVSDNAQAAANALTMARLPLSPRVFVTATDVKAHKLHLLSSYTHTSTLEATAENVASNQANQTGKYKVVPVFSILQAALATSAAPTVLKNVVIGSTLYQDGALMANNPSSVAVQEARRLWPRRLAYVTENGTFKEPDLNGIVSATVVPISHVPEVDFHLSIGTGRQPEGQNAAWSLLAYMMIFFVSQVLDVEKVDEQLRTDVYLNARNKYCRLQPDASVGAVRLNETDKRVLDAMEESTRNFLRNQPGVSGVDYTAAALLSTLFYPVLKRTASNQTSSTYHLWFASRSRTINFTSILSWSLVVELSVDDTFKLSNVINPLSDVALIDSSPVYEIPLAKNTISYVRCSLRLVLPAPPRDPGALPIPPQTLSCAISGCPFKLSNIV